MYASFSAALSKLGKEEARLCLVVVGAAAMAWSQASN